MFHVLRLINYERKPVNYDKKVEILRRSSLVALLAIKYFKKNSDKFIGKSEKYAAKAVKRFCRKRGYSQAFPLLLSSGENTQKIHARPSKRIIRNNDIIMIDIGLKRTAHYLSDYCSDCTRTFFLGQPSEFQQQVYSIVKEAQTLALENLKPKIRGCSLHKKVRDFLESKGYDLPHGLGHSTRRYTHASPFLSKMECNSYLKRGDHVTIEPGVYINKDHPKLPKGHPSFGVRIEDLVLITNIGYLALTRPKNSKMSKIEKKKESY